MKKIRLNVASMNATEILSRDQLKSIFGGGSYDDSVGYVNPCKGGTWCPIDEVGKACKTYNGDDGKCGVKPAETGCKCIAN